jgi:hypothetical protein
VEIRSAADPLRQSVQHLPGRKASKMPEIAPRKALARFLPTGGNGMPESRQKPCISLPCWL